ncbi:MAG: DUF86 domain-containing protein [Anaerosomatales bacterium]
MCGRRSESAYVADMLQACERMLVFASGVSDEDLMRHDRPHRGAVLHELIVLGEAAKHVSDSRRTMMPAIPWADMTGMRDKLVHYYHGVDELLVVNAVRTSVPAILPLLRTMLAEMDVAHE